MSYRIECYDGSQHPAVHPYTTDTATDMRAARKSAAAMLGKRSLRGASTWDRYQGGTVWQFGPRTEDNGRDFSVIVDEAEEAREAARDH